MTIEEGEKGEGAELNSGAGALQCPWGVFPHEGAPLYPLDGDIVHINQSRYIIAGLAKYIITKLLAFIAV